MNKHKPLCGRPQKSKHPVEDQMDRFCYARAAAAAVHIVIIATGI